MKDARNRQRVDEKTRQCERLNKYLIFLLSCQPWMHCIARILLFDRSVFYLRGGGYVGDARRLLTGYRSSRRKCGNVVRIDRNVWMVYISTNGYVSSWILDGGWFFTFKNYYVRRRIERTKREKMKDYVCDGITELLITVSHLKKN